MTRVQRRMLRRKRRRRRILICLAAITACAVVVLMLRKPIMQTEWIAGPTPTPVASAFDRSVSSREVLLPAQTWYTIQTGVFSTQEAANEKAGAYTDRGAPGTVVEDGGKWRVFIASYGREEDAASVRQRLGEQQRVETYLYPWTCPELHLRLTGMAGQLDAAEAGLTLFSNAADILRDTASLLDASQLTISEAMQSAADIDAQITLWVETIRSRFDQQTPALVSQMMKIAEEWKRQYNAIRKADESAISLSATLKGCGMEIFDAMIRLRKSLASE